MELEICRSRVIKNSMDLKDNKRTILTNNEFALNMDDILMVKPDNSCATKSGHFYLLLTAKWINHNK